MTKHPTKRFAFLGVVNCKVIKSANRTGKNSVSVVGVNHWCANKLATLRTLFLPAQVVVLQY